MFETILGIGYEIKQVSDIADVKDQILPSLVYGLQSEDLMSIPEDGLLFSDIIEKQEVRIENKTFPELHFSKREFKGYSIDFDLFSSAFYLITQYELYHTRSYDDHDRYHENITSIQLHEFQNIPLVEVYAEYVWKILKSKYPDLKRKPHQFDYKITFDIDSPYLYKHKSLVVTLGSLTKNLFRLNISAISAQLKTVFGGTDPYDVYDDILERVDKEKTIFFFLIQRNSRHDGRHTHNSQPYRKLMKKISDSGIKVGIHPSYTSFRNKEMIRNEKEILEKCIEKPVIASRMHFLKYRLPETFEYLISAGIKEDYTLCPIHHSGFKSFMIRAYSWFDLSSNSETSITIYPTIVMDRSLQQYMKLNPEDAILEIRKMIDICKTYNGLFTILFHNDSLSETAEWKGWKPVFENTIMYLSGKN